MGCSPWGREESDRTERLHFHFSLSCIGEGNGNPLQCSSLENPRDGGAWWAAIYGVAQSRTGLKGLTSKKIKRGATGLGQSESRVGPHPAGDWRSRMGCCCGSGACTPPRYSLQTAVSPCSYPARVHKPLSLLSDLLGSAALVDLSKWSGPLSLQEVAERPQHPLRQGGGRRTGQSA